MTATYTPADLANAKRAGSSTHGPTPMHFKAWDFGAAGETVVLYREPHHTLLDIDRAVKALHAERAVTCLHVALPEQQPARRPITPFNTGDANARR